MNLFTYLEKHGELENASNALVYFARRRMAADPDVIAPGNNCVFKIFNVIINNTTSRVGQYHPRKKHIELHEGLLVAGREDEHKQTLLHEVAHLIVRHIWRGCFGVKSHGREWRMVMYHLGIPATRCHSSDWMNEHVVKKARLIYACRKCELEIPAQKIRKKLLKRGVTHRRCGGSFYLKEDRRNG